MEECMHGGLASVVPGGSMMSGVGRGEARGREFRGGHGMCTWCMGQQQWRRETHTQTRVVCDR
jgi:hypothetical protein